MSDDKPSSQVDNEETGSDHSLAPESTENASLSEKDLKAEKGQEQPDNERNVEDGPGEATEASANEEKTGNGNHESETEKGKTQKSAEHGKSLAWSHVAPLYRRFLNGLLVFVLLLLTVTMAMSGLRAFELYGDISNIAECKDRAAADEVCEINRGMSPENERWVALGAALLAGGLTILAGALFIKRLWNFDAGRSSLKDRGSGAMILSTAALFISIGAVATVIVYVLPIESTSFQQLRSYLAVVAGVACAIAVAVFNLAFRSDPVSARQGQSRVYDELRQRSGSLNARLISICSEESLNRLPNERLKAEAPGLCHLAKLDYAELKRALEHKRTDTNATNKSQTRESDDDFVLGSKWITGTGYIELWNRIHNAEESLLVVASQEQVVAAGLFDESRLMGSTIQNRESLLDRLLRALWVLGGSRYFSDERLRLYKVDGQNPCGQDELQARLVIRDVRHAINQFRDKSREALIRARNQLMWTGMLTGVAAFTVLLLAVLAGAPPKTILASAVFFLCGAVVGLFDQLRTSGNAISPEEDFGLGRARLLYTPYISGLAAIGGVLVTAMLYATVNGSALKYQPPTPLPTQAVAADASTTTLEPTQTPAQEEVPAGSLADGEEGGASGGEPSAPNVDGASTPIATSTPSPTATPTEAPSPTVSPTAQPTAAPSDVEDQDLVAANVQLDPPPLALVFDLDENRFGLVIAAIFGLTPSLLISRLQGEANRYQADLQSTSGQDRRI